MMRVGQLEDRLRGPAIGSVRILAGLLWLANLHWKVPTDFGESSGGGLYKYVAAGADNAPLAPFRWALRELVLPNFTLFGWFTLISETAVAACLLIGYRARLVALIGAAMAIPIGLTVIYYPRADEWSWSYLLMIGLHLLLWAAASDEHLAVDGVLGRPPKRANDALRTIGIVAVVIGIAGLFVARSVDFVGDSVALLGSDAGFVVDDTVTRRWELKLLWFNPSWALLTIAFGALLIVGVRYRAAAIAAVVGFAALAVAAAIVQTFDYVRDDGSVQRISTGSNVAVWGGIALAAGVIGRHASGSSDDERVGPTGPT